MFDRLSNGFAMARSSWHVIMSDKKLLWFPFVSGILFILVVASFLVPIGMLHQEGKFLDANGKPHMWFYPVAFAFYFCTYFVIIFCNAALVSLASLRFNGETASLGDGFRAAMSRLPQIFAWALLSATVGLILKLIENAHEKVGEFIASILGTAWSIMTYFVVPILVVEKTGPFEAVSRSISIMKKTWGEMLGGKLGMGFFMFLLAIPIILLLIAGIYMMTQPQMHAVGIALLVAGGIGLILHATISSAMYTVLTAAVYQYATTDRVPEGYDRYAMANAFAPQGR